MTLRRASPLSIRAFALLTLGFAAAASAQPTVPALTGRVVDRADMLSASVEASVAARLAAHEDSTGVQIAVLTVPSLEGAALEAFATEVFRTWGLGDAERNDGVLVLIARDERQIRIEVGYGLEGSVTDARAGRIIRGEMTPRFRQGDVDGGVLHAVDALVLLTGGLPDDLDAKVFDAIYPDASSPIDFFRVSPLPVEDTRSATVRSPRPASFRVGMAMLGLLALPGVAIALWLFWTRGGWTPESRAILGFLTILMAVPTAFVNALFFGTVGPTAAWWMSLNPVVHVFVGALTWVALGAAGEHLVWRRRLPRLDRWRRVYAAQRERIRRRKADAVSKRRTIAIPTWHGTLVYNGKAEAERRARAAASSRSSSGGSSWSSSSSGSSWSGGSSSSGGSSFSGGGGSSGGGGASGGW